MANEQIIDEDFIGHDSDKTIVDMTHSRLCWEDILDS